MDINAGQILEGASVEEVGREIFEKIIATASGEKTLSEQQGIGDDENSVRGCRARSFDKPFKLKLPKQ